MRSAVAVTCIFLAAACAPQGTPTDSNAESTALDRILSDAKDYGVSERQLSTLEMSHESREMSFEALSSLMPDFVECVETVGGHVDLMDPREPFPGVRAPGYSVSVPDDDNADGVLAMVDACALSTFAFAESYYLGQPVVLQSYDAYFEDNRERLITCLAENGIQLDAQASVDEIIRGLIQDGESHSHVPGWNSCYEGDVLAVRRR